MQFCIAILLLERRAQPAQFTDEVVARPDVRAVMERVDFGIDSDAETSGYNNMTTRIRCEMTDGRILEKSASFGKGSPENPMSDKELVDKFLDCLDWAGIPASAGRRVAERVLALEEEDSWPTYWRR